MSDQSAQRLRILISAFACRPGQGSEPGVGWNWANQLAISHDVWVLLPERERELVEAYKGELPPGLHLVYSDMPKIIRPKPGSTLNYMIHYHMWQLWVYFDAVKLHRKISFDVAHHLTIGAHWKPSLLGLLPVPFIWGPVGGAETCPASFGRFLGWRSLVFENSRKLVQGICERNPLVCMTARRAVLGLAKSSETARRLRSMKCRDVRVFSEAGIPETEMQRLNSIPAPQGACRFLSLGRLLNWKGFEFGLRAFARVHRSIPEARFGIVGDGPARSRLERIANELGIAEKVDFYGRLPRAEALEKLAESTVLVHPSLHDSGGWACLEAMAAGRPVVCLNIGGPAAQVTEETGFKIEPASPQKAIEEMARVMCLLANSPELVARMGAAGRAHVKHQYALDGKVRAITDLYFTCIQSTAAQRRNVYVDA